MVTFNINNNTSLITAANRLKDQLLEIAAPLSDEGIAYYGLMQALGIVNVNVSPDAAAARRNIDAVKEMLNNLVGQAEREGAFANRIDPPLWDYKGKAADLGALPRSGDEHRKAIWAAVRHFDPPHAIAVLAGILSTILSKDIWPEHRAGVIEAVRHTLENPICLSD